MRMTCLKYQASFFWLGKYYDSLQSLWVVYKLYVNSSESPKKPKRDIFLLAMSQTSKSKFLENQLYSAQRDSTIGSLPPPYYSSMNFFESRIHTQMILLHTLLPTSSSFPHSWSSLNLYQIILLDAWQEWWKSRLSWFSYLNVLLFLWSPRMERRNLTKRVKNTIPFLTNI